MRLTSFLRLLTPAGRALAAREACSPDTLTTSLLFSDTMRKHGREVGLFLTDRGAQMPVIVHMADWPRTEAAAVLDHPSLAASRWDVVDDRIVDGTPMTATVRGKRYDVDGRSVFHAHFLAIA